MKNFILILLALNISNKTYCQKEALIIPAPNKVEYKEGSFELTERTTIKNNLNTQEIAVKIVEYFDTSYSLNLQTQSSLNENENFIALVEDPSMGKEDYYLAITNKGITIRGGSTSGIFYGFQSLKQLIPLVHDGNNKEGEGLRFSAIEIEDSPRFRWRAYMLDESRYFMGEKFVKRMLDQMALLKMNVFHWHLTDDAGWRIEIKKYPKLTEVGSRRADSESGTWKSGLTSGVPHGGFYTQEQIKDIVAYASERQITIVPEFEMPGHSSAAIASYPWLGTTGEKIDVPIVFGRHYDNYDITKPEVIQFIQDVLLEMFYLFPSEVIHIGGDEVGYQVWEESDHVNKYMKAKGLNTPADLQIYFTNNISNFIERNNRRMMGWNEIMGVNIHEGFEEKKDDKEAETELAKNVIIHFWKGNLELATEAVEKGYGIVNSLHSNTYLDYTYESISLEKAYAFEPIPKGLDQKYHSKVYGTGCQMWTEWTPTYKEVEYQTFPRIAAFAEVGWTKPERKNFNSFQLALEELQKYWTSLGINYARK